LTEAANLPPIPLVNSTLREFVHVSIGGKHLRVRLSNFFGANAVTLNAVHIAPANRTGSMGTGDINMATDNALTFQWAATITIPAGESVLSDSVDYGMPALGDLAITIWFWNVPANTITGHPG